MEGMLETPDRRGIFFADDLDGRSRWNYTPVYFRLSRMIKELDLIVLERDVPEAGLTRGDIGTVVGIYADQQGFEVEFMTAEGKTIDVLTLEREDIRPFSGHEILHSREMEMAS